MVSPPTLSYDPPTLKTKDSRWNLSKLVPRRPKEAPKFILQLEGLESAPESPTKPEGLGLELSRDDAEKAHRKRPSGGVNVESVHTSPAASADAGQAGAVVKDEKGAQAEEHDDVHSMGGLFTRETFRQLLDNPIGLYKFGLFMASELNTEGLVFWLSSQHHLKMLDDLQAFNQNIFENHITAESPMSLNISSNQRRALEKACIEFRKVPDPFATARQFAFDSMYDDAYPRFIKKRLAAKTRFELDRANSNRRQGLGDAFVVSEATASSDLRIRSVSDGFCRLTGYERRFCVGRNCRFLSGPGTSRSVQQRIRRACTEGEPCVELLLNYNSLKLPFWNLLAIVPLYDGDGQLALFLGAQINISSLLASSRDMASLLSDELDPPGSQQDPAVESKRQDVVGIQYASALATINEHISAKLDPATSPRPLVGTPKLSKARRLVSAVGRLPGMSPKSPVSSPKPSPNTSRPSTAASTDLPVSPVTDAATPKPEHLAPPKPDPGVAAKPKSNHYAGESSDKVPEMAGPRAPRAARLSSESRAAWEAHRRPKSSGGRRLHSAPAVGLRSRLVDNSLHFSEQTRLLEQASNSFLILDPHSFAVLYSCASLQKEFARVPNFLKAVKSRFKDGAEIAKKLKESIREAACCDVTAETLPEEGETDTRRLTIHVTPLKDGDSMPVMVVVALTGANPSSSS